MTLLDTHVLIWLLAGDARLGRQARASVDHAFEAGTLGVSAITVWDVAMLCAKGRLSIGEDVHSWRAGLLDVGLVEVAVDGDIGIQAAELASLHGDPADRIIAASARARGAALVTADERLLAWPGDALIVDARR